MWCGRFHGVSLSPKLDWGLASRNSGYVYTCSLVGIKRDDLEHIWKSCALTWERRRAGHGHPGLVPAQSRPGLDTLCPSLPRAHWSRAGLCPLHQTPEQLVQAWERRVLGLSSRSPHHSGRKLQTVPLGPGLSIPSLALTAPRAGRTAPECPA